jgi:hypothetical protein
MTPLIIKTESPSEGIRITLSSQIETFFPSVGATEDIDGRIIGFLEKEI